MIAVEVRAKPAAPGRQSEDGGRLEIDASGDELMLRVTTNRGGFPSMSLSLSRAEMRVLSTALRAERKAVRK